MQNPGFYCCLVSTFLLIVLIGFSLYRSKWKLDIEGVTYFEGRFYETNIDPDFYFNERTRIKRAGSMEKGTDITMAKDDNINSSRGLNDSPTKGPELVKNKDLLVLGDNKNGADQDIKGENVNTGNTGNTGVKTQPDNNVIIINNYLPSESSKAFGEQSINYIKSVKTEYKSVTTQDYLVLSKEKTMTYDQRDILQYIKDEYKLNHSIVMLFRQSLLYPGAISSLKIIFKVNSLLFLNSLALIDIYIEARSEDPSRVSIPF
jgi:hypothetical protein